MSQKGTTMFKHLIISIMLVFTSSAISANDDPYIAEKLVENRDIEKEAKAIQSMEQVKQTLRQLISLGDECGTGSCHNSASLRVCDYMALVDIRLDGELGIGTTSGNITHGFKVTKQDIALLKKITNSCKMSSYQHGNFPLLTHVRYLPSPKDEAWINKQLQIHYHDAQTPPEKALAAILKSCESDKNFIVAVLKRPWAENRANNYNNILSEKLMKSWETAEVKMVKESCGGKYQDGEQCGFDYNPLTCSQDQKHPYLYRTIEQNDSTAIIQYAWAEKNPSVRAQYKMVKKDKKWILDGVSCISGDKFNME